MEAVSTGDFSKVITKKSKKYAVADRRRCVSCGACAANCPVEAITEGDGQYVIDPEKCISCGACAENCPVGAPAEE